MMFIQKYYRARNKNQEAEFNLGRAFHQLGEFFFCFFQDIMID